MLPSIFNIFISPLRSHPFLLQKGMPTFHSHLNSCSYKIMTYLFVKLEDKIYTLKYISIYFYSFKNEKRLFSVFSGQILISPEEQNGLNGVRQYL